MTEIVLGIRGYKSSPDRERAIKQLRNRGWNYFVCFKDKKFPFAVQYGCAPWLKKGECYVDR